MGGRVKRAQKVVCVTVIGDYVLAQDWQSRSVDEWSGAAPGTLERVRERWPKAEIRVAGAPQP
jgi:hypothetical protein